MQLLNLMILFFNIYKSFTLENILYIIKTYRGNHENIAFSLILHFQYYSIKILSTISSVNTKIFI